ncbi:uncharacterized protein LOC108673845 [Hyalella azteca]|uniref:Uncharacterized protein LOC108673845 n=1 Tax=Hyalella azteca TaxID=294128 RepID=A0A8B7NWB8_HYAAZ|nr:uncharacterized protein LOC108673845 [Hyalella azteca]
MMTLFCAIWSSFLVLASSSPIEKEITRADDLRYLIGYSEPYSTGVSYTFTEYVPDLSVVMMDDIIDSVCGTGLWILYDSINYDSNHEVCVYEGVNGCGTWDTFCWNVGSSLRYAGSPSGINNDYYNLYKGTTLRGEEFRGATDAADLGIFDLTISSLVVTGQSAWTFYEGLNFSGSAVCVYADQHISNNGTDLDFIHVLALSEIGLPNNSIRSVKRGCHAERVVGAPLNGTRGGGKTSMTSATEEMDAMSITRVHTVHV